MPLYKTINPNSQTVVKIWKIEESYTSLLTPLTLKPESLERVLGMKSELHQRGFLSVRHLLMLLGYTDFDLFYDKNGKPHLKDGKQISITHSFEYAAVIISDLKIGIDIEKQRDKIAVIAHKFIDYEFQYLNKTALDYRRKLTVIWCAKESLYKLFATPGVSFKNNFLVIPFEIKDTQTVAWIDYNNTPLRYDVYFVEFDGFTCAYAIA